MSTHESTLVDVLERMTRTTKAYPESWSDLIAADSLAIAIYYTRTVKFGLPVRSWDDLTDGARDKYREDARSVLEHVKPHGRRTHWFRAAVTVVTGLKRADRIIGAIQPNDKGAA